MLKVQQEHLVSTVPRVSPVRLEHQALTATLVLPVHLVLLAALVVEASLVLLATQVLILHCSC